MIQNLNTQYNLVSINRNSQSTQTPFFGLTNQIINILRSEIALGVLTIDITTKTINEIENFPLLCRYSKPTSPTILSEDQKVWRYLDFKKFEDLITTSKLHFSRIDQFEDNLEGVSPESCKAAINADSRFSDEQKVKHIALFEKRMNHNRQSGFVSCWHINNQINEEMWRNYGDTKKPEENIAIQTTIINLKRSFNQKIPEIIFEPIRYFEEPFFNQESYLFPSIFKQKQYDYEKEYRLSFYAMSSGLVKFTKISVNLQNLISSIYVHQRASEEFVQKIENLLKDNNCNLPILRK